MRQHQMNTGYVPPNSDQGHTPDTTQHMQNAAPARPKKRTYRNGIKVAEHSFQEPIPNSPLLLSYLCFGARFLQESRLTTEGFILTFWLR